MSLTLVTVVLLSGNILADDPPKSSGEKYYLIDGKVEKLSQEVEDLKRRLKALENGFKPNSLPMPKEKALCDGKCGATCTCFPYGCPCQTNGVVTQQPKAVVTQPQVEYYFPQNNCPGGVCPTPTYSSPSRFRLFRR